MTSHSLTDKPLRTLVSLDCPRLDIFERAGKHRSVRLEFDEECCEHGGTGGDAAEDSSLVTSQLIVHSEVSSEVCSRHAVIARWLSSE
ncbi:hypothetical protein BaRGS_00002841 [Batillaria attramentaria]|uniref:Uncharacterized protein n=1 Tax=Batillaria attramentaria TaxID=370345 RepID=A0ABD0M2J1_9CAEN